MTRRQAIKMLKSNEEIVALDLRSYLMFLALAIEIGSKDLEVKLAEVKKGF